MVNNGIISEIRRKLKPSDSCDSDFIALITLLTTPICDFHKVINVSALMTLRICKVAILTLSLVKTSLTVKNRFSCYIFTRRHKI